MMSKTEQIEDTAASFSEPVEIFRLGKDEMNLAEFPITLLTDRVPKGKKVIQFQDKIFDEKTGQHITRKLTISADEAHGLPTAVDDDVILGLIQLTKTVNNFASREVEYSRLDLIRMLGWPDSGESYRRLATSLKRWLSVTLLYENAWRDNRKGAWTTKGFHILDNIELNDTRTLTDQGDLFPSRITWNKVVFESFAAGYLKSIDYGLYIKLKHTIARRLYRFLSKRMYFGPEVSFELRDLAFAHVGMSDSYSGNAGKIKEKLQPAIEELEAVGFLEPLGRDERYQKEGKVWKIRFIAKAKAPSLPTLKAAETEPPKLVNELVRRGVTPSTAAGLVQDHAERVERQIEIFDWLMSRKDRRLEKSPSGFLVESIKIDYAVPKGFVSTAVREQQEEAARLAEQRAAKNHQAKLKSDQQERLLAEQAKAYRKSRTPEQLAQLEADAIASASEHTRLGLDEPPMKRFRESQIVLLVNEHIIRLIQSGQLAIEPA